jgi:tRNA (adenine22-N1)-methyltransferase
MKLSPRLESVVAFVDEGAYIADVGSDHAQVPLRLFELGVIRGAEAIENKKGPFAHMTAALAASPYAGKCRLSLSDGTSDLVPEADTLILAGMGGPLIEKILNAHPEKLAGVKVLIIDAHNERPALIAALGQLGYRLAANDFLWDEGIAYDVMKWEKSPAAVAYSKRECEFGPRNLVQKPAAWRLYWEKETQRLEGILAQEGLPPKRRHAYEKQLKEIQEALS